MILFLHLEYKEITLKTQLLKLRLALEIAGTTTKAGLYRRTCMLY